MSAYTWFNGEWLEGRTPIMSAMTLGTWLSSMVFDGARSFEGVAPDLDRHAERTCRSAESFGMNPFKSAGEIVEIAREGIAKYPSGTPLYIKPMYWAEDGWIAPDPETTQFALNIWQAPLPPDNGFSACVTSRRRPAPDMAPTDAKASCLYPNAGRAMQEIKAKGYDNAVMLDGLGNVAEFATANLFYAKEGAVFTPAPNGTFLNGITRQRVIGLLADRGVAVHETRVLPDDLLDADEIFSTGNYGKVMFVGRYEDRDLQPGPMYRLAKELYWEFAHAGG